MHKWPIILGGIVAASCATAEPLRFQTVNPSFWGNPLNSSHLMSLANKQYVAPVITKERQTDLENFADQIRRRTLSAIASVFTANLRNLDLNSEEDIDDFIFGNFTVSYDTSDPTKIVLILTEGDETIRIDVPNF
jgi:curli production assembly/transport component CsgF